LWQRDRYIDKARKSEYARRTGNDRRFIKGPKYTLLSRRDNLLLDGKRSLALLLAANKRLNTAYVLKELFAVPFVQTVQT
jgi:transposase